MSDKTLDELIVDAERALDDAVVSGNRMAQLRAGDHLSRLNTQKLLGARAAFDQAERGRAHVPAVNDTFQGYDSYGGRVYRSPQTGQTYTRGGKGRPDTGGQS